MWRPLTSLLPQMAIFSKGGLDWAIWAVRLRGRSVSVGWRKDWSGWWLGQGGNRLRLINKQIHFFFKGKLKTYILKSFPALCNNCFSTPVWKKLYLGLFHVLNSIAAFIGWTSGFKKRKRKLNHAKVTWVESGVEPSLSWFIVGMEWGLGFDKELSAWNWLGRLKKSPTLYASQVTWPHPDVIVQPIFLWLSKDCEVLERVPINEMLDSSYWLNANHAPCSPCQMQLSGVHYKSNNRQ